MKSENDALERIAAEQGKTVEQLVNEPIRNCFTKADVPRFLEICRTAKFNPKNGSIDYPFLEDERKMFWDGRFITESIAQKKLGEYLHPVGDYWADGAKLFASVLSDVAPCYLERPWTDEFIGVFDTDVSFAAAAEYVQNNADCSIHYGWILCRYLITPVAFFHAAVKDRNGELKLLVPTPGLPFHRAVIFVPDDVNKLDFDERTFPCHVNFRRDGKILVAKDKPQRKHGEQLRVLKTDTDLIKNGKAPHHFFSKALEKLLKRTPALERILREHQEKTEV